MIYRIKYIHPNGVVVHEEVSNKEPLCGQELFTFNGQTFKLKEVTYQTPKESKVTVVTYDLSLISNKRVCLSFVSIKTGAPVKLVETNKFCPEEACAGKTIYDSDGVAYTILGHSKMSYSDVTEYRIFVEEQ